MKREKRETRADEVEDEHSAKLIRPRRNNGDWSAIEGREIRKSRKSIAEAELCIRLVKELRRWGRGTTLLAVIIEQLDFVDNAKLKTGLISRGERSILRE